MVEHVQLLNDGKPVGVFLMDDGALVFPAPQERSGVPEEKQYDIGILIWANGTKYHEP